MFGHVTSLITGLPITMVEVGAYRGSTRIDHAYTDSQGRYDLDVPAGERITVRFDTHETLNNAESWHPSVVTDVVVDDRAALDRRLLPVGHAAGEDAAVDALSGYLFAVALWDAENDEQYLRAAASRLTTLKQSNRTLQEIQHLLLERLRNSG